MTSPSCPFCNALISPAESAGRLLCPRCGEPLPQTWTLAGKNGVSSKASSPEPAVAGRSNRTVIALLMGGMGLAALVGLVLALSTWKAREGRHPNPRPPDGFSSQTGAPGDAPTLGYLPADTNLVAGVHLADLRKHALGKQLLEPPRPALFESALALVGERTGLKAREIDHVIFGTTLKGELPQLTAVVRTTRPYRLEDLAGKFPAAPLRHHKKPLFRFKGNPTGGGFLWCPDDRTLVMTVRLDLPKIEDMGAVPATPRPGADGLPEPLRPVLEQRLRHSAVWLAGFMSQPQPLEALSPWAPMPKELALLLTQARTFSLGIQLQEKLTLLAGVEGRTIAGSQAWQRFWETVKIPGLDSRTVVPSAAQQTLWLAAGTAASAGLDPFPGAPLHLLPPQLENWVNVQLRLSTEGIQALMAGRGAR
jgi:hypothetical protein